jgi:arylsulfatase A-like enzyme
MRRTTAIVTVVVICFAASAFAAEKPRNVILFGWDGAQREHVQQCLQKGELPTLKKVAEQGVMVELDIEGTTDTKAGWSQILTGYYPDKTGVYSNARFQPVPKGYSIFERLEQQFGPEKFVTVAVIAKKAHCGEIKPPRKIELKAGDDPDKLMQEIGAKDMGGVVQPGAKTKAQGKVVEENGKKYLVINGSPYYNMYSALEVWEYGLIKDEVVGKRTIELLDKYKDKPFFFFVHFAQVDASGHKNGENSKEYNDALISNDAWTGKILEKVKALGLADTTDIYITADHGFNEDAKGHGFAPYVFLATNNKAVKRNGRRQDVAATIYDDFGVDTSKFEPKLDGISLTRPDTRPAAKIEPPAKPKPKAAAQKKAAGAKKKQGA